MFFSQNTVQHIAFTSSAMLGAENQPASPKMSRIPLKFCCRQRSKKHYPIHKGTKDDH